MVKILSFIILIPLTYFWLLLILKIVYTMKMLGDNEN